MKAILAFAEKARSIGWPSPRGATSVPGAAQKLAAVYANLHLLRHACGYKLANDGQDTRALQHYLGHKNIQHTVRYTEMAPGGFKDFWKD